MSTKLSKVQLRSVFLVAYSHRITRKKNYSRYNLAQEISENEVKEDRYISSSNVVRKQNNDPRIEKFEKLTEQLSKQREYQKRIDLQKSKASKRLPAPKKKSLLNALMQLPYQAIWTTILSSIILLIAAIVYYVYSTGNYNPPLTGLNYTNNSSKSTLKTTTSASFLGTSTITSSEVTKNNSTSQTLQNSSLSSSTISLNLFNDNGESINIIEYTIEEVSKNPLGIIVDKVHRLPSSYIPIDLVDTGVTGGGKLKKEAANLLKEMFASAKEEGLNLKVISSFRSYDEQNSLFNYYIQQELDAGAKNKDEATQKANEYSAKPGHSEHQLGTTVDIVCATCDGFTYNQENLAVWAYLEKNAPRFGYKLSYPKDNTSGYMYEPWHFRYYGL